MVNDDNTSIARAAITLKPSVYMGNPNPNVHLKSNATANEITKLIMIITSSLSSKVAALNKEICTPKYTTNFS